MSGELDTAGQSALDRYDPEQGLKSIAVAETAERHFKRARDPEKLQQAVTLKLTEQRKFVLWWDKQKKHPGNRPLQTGDGQKAGVDGLPDRDTIHRWRQRLKDARKFEAALAMAQERCLRICEAAAKDYARAINTGEFEWYTPAEWLERARRVLGGFDLDPASSSAAQELVRAERFFTVEDDGLAHEWHGRVWLNPPYMQPHMADFVSKLIAEFNAGRVSAAILLTHNYTDTGWFHEAANVSVAICFPRGRIAFVDTKGERAAPSQGQAFFYFGKDLAAFLNGFSDVGLAVARL